MGRTVRAYLGDLPPLFAGLLLILVLATAVSRQRYVAVWQDEPSLWAYAVQLSPAKPRTVNNYAVTLVMLGQLSEARAEFERAHQAGHSPRLPQWDREIGRASCRERV